MATTFNVLDLIFFSITIIFVATAFFRGFVKEMFALGGWILSFLLSCLLAPVLSDFLAPHFTSKVSLDITMQVLVFGLTFIGFAIFTEDLSTEMKYKISNALDRSLGVFYGLIKTLIVFGFIYAIAINILSIASGKKENSEKILPKWFKEAKCHNLIRISGETLDLPTRKILASFIHAIEKNKSSSSKDKEMIEEKDEKKIEEKKSEEKEKTKVKNNNSQRQAKDSGYDGYSKKDLEKMNHLIDIIDK